MIKKSLLRRLSIATLTTIFSFSSLISTTTHVNAVTSDFVKTLTSSLSNSVSDEVSVIAQNGTKIKIDKKNSVRSGNMIVVYTDAYGKGTKTNEWGIEVQVNSQGIVTYIRKQGEKNPMGTEIPKHGFVISSFGKDFNQILLDNFKVGDKVKLLGLELVELNKQSYYQIAAINPNKETNPLGVDSTGVPFPGFRGADQIVVYTKDWNNATTGTNDYGYEVRVSGTLEKGVVSSIGGNNSSIPQDGYVLSAHGAGASFLINNAVIGANVSIDPSSKKIIISVTPESLLSSVEKELVSVEDIYNKAKANLLDIPYDKAKESLDASKLKLKEAKLLLDSIKNTQSNTEDLEIKFVDMLDEARQNILLTNYRTMESKKVEARALWHRPNETNINEIKDHLDELAKNNFNLVFLETFWQGYSIYPSSVQYVKQHPLFASNSYGEYGNDILKAFVEEGKKRGIEVHAWCEDFFVGEESKKPQSPILEQRPDWKLLNYDGSYITKKEGGKYLFMDPAIPEVRSLLINLYKEIIEKYDVKGLQLDYIRYPVGEYKNDTGYGEYSVKAFKSLYKIDDNIDIKDLMDKDKNPNTWESWWNKWNLWKQENVSNFVKSVRDELKSKKSNIIISTAIFPSTTEALEKKMQNWPLWVKNGWIDLTTPMAYYKDTTTVRGSILNMVKFVDGVALNYAGIAPTFMGLEASKNADQIQASQLGLAQGVSIFASQNVLGLSDVQTVLKESAFRNPSILPHANMHLILKECFDDILSKSDRLYIPNGKMSSAQMSNLASKFNAIKNLPVNNSKDIKLIQSNITSIINDINNYADGAAAHRIKDSLQYINTILTTRASILKRDTTEIDPSDSTISLPKTGGLINNYSLATIGSLLLILGIYVTLKRKIDIN